MITIDELNHNCVLAGINDAETAELVSAYRMLCENSAMRTDFDRIIAGFRHMEPVADPQLGDRFNLLLALAFIRESAHFYRERHIADQIRLDGLQDVRLWVNHHWENFGELGLQWRLLTWEIAIMRAEILQFGRLQCNREYRWHLPFKVFRRGSTGEVRQTDADAPAPDGDWEIALTLDDPCINLHIPASGPLDIAQCLDSLRRMERFFNGQYRAFVCQSWFLDRQLQDILPATSNIVRFQKLGHLFPSEEESDAIWRVFGENARVNGIDAVEPKTAMQKTLAGFIRNGGRLQGGGIYILTSELDGLAKPSNCTPLK